MSFVTSTTPSGIVVTSTIPGNTIAQHMSDLRTHPLFLHVLGLPRYALHIFIAT